MVDARQCLLDIKRNWYISNINQYGCLNKAGVMAVPVDMPVWTEEFHKVSLPWMKNYRQSTAVGRCVGLFSVNLTQTKVIGEKGISVRK